MDDQRTHRAGGESARRTLRLALLMIVGAFGAVFIVPHIGNPLEIALSLLFSAIIGAFGGLVVELLIRPSQSPTKTLWRYGIGELLVALTIAAIGLWIIVSLFKVGLPTD